MVKIYNTKEIVGGKSISGSIISAGVSVIKTVYSVGQGLGGAVRRIITGQTCQISRSY